MKDLASIREVLRHYDGKPLALMEVCGSHTAAISKLGIPSLLSPKIRLISGPGCPVCVTPSAYIDRLIQWALTPGVCVATFGDLLRVPGSTQSLAQAKGEGASVLMLYSPFDLLPHCKAHPETTYLFAAIGFETTTPVYALLLQQALQEGIQNLKLLTALKTMPEAMEALCAQGSPVDGFLAPGHVAVVIGSEAFRPLTRRFCLPVAVAGFTGESILQAIYGLVRMQSRPMLANFYPSVVTETGNRTAQELVDRFFEPCDASWRGLGILPHSGRRLRPEYAAFDAGSQDLLDDRKKNRACRCSDVLTGRLAPPECPLFGKVCRPMTPQGACMVSEEGSCFQFFTHHRER